MNFEQDLCLRVNLKLKTNFEQDICVKMNLKLLYYCRHLHLQLYNSTIITTVIFVGHLYHMEYELWPEPCGIKPIFTKCVAFGLIPAMQ